MNNHRQIPTDLTLHFDGAIQGNPGGQMSFGWHLDTEDGIRVAEDGGLIHGYSHDESTNNTAEMEAMLAGLKWVAGLRLFSVNVLTVVGDSQLAIRIVSGQWKAKKPHLQRLRNRCQAVLNNIAGHVEFVWVPREQNARADALAELTS